MKKVIATLEYGHLAMEADGAKFYIIFMTVFFSFVFIYTVSMVGCLIGGVIEAEEGLILAIVLMDILSTIFFSIAVSMLVYDKKMRKAIQSWQDDFVETTATVIDESFTYHEFRFWLTVVKLTVEFVIDGKKYRRNLVPRKQKLLWLGCYGSMRKLAASNVPIYYSKKNDQVVFIKWR